MSFLDKPTLSADNGSFFQKNLVYQTEKPTLSEINLLYLIIVTTACHKQGELVYRSLLIDIYVSELSMSVSIKLEIKVTVFTEIGPICSQKSEIENENDVMVTGRQRWTNTCLL